MSTAAIKLDLSYRGIIRAVKRHNVKLTPLANGGDYKHNNRGCALVAATIDAGVDYSSRKRNQTAESILKMDGIEHGFEGWTHHNACEDAIFKRYYAIGQRVRSYAGLPKKGGW